MRSDQYQDFEKIMDRAALLTYQQKGKDWRKLINAMFEELAQYELEEVRMAVAAHVRLEKFFPMLADIVKRIDNAPEERAALAWSIVIDAIRYICSSCSVAFPSPAYNYAIKQMGGWIKLCQGMMDDEIKWRRKEFERFFIIGEPVASWEHEPGKVQVDRYCVGTYEVNNRVQGYALPDVLDARTRQPIIGFRDALPALSEKVIPMVEALAARKAAP